MGLFSKRTTYSTSLMRSAYSAGLRAGDTGGFRQWIDKHDDGSLTRAGIERVKDAYVAGVQSVGLVPRSKQGKQVYERELFKQLANPMTRRRANPTLRKIGKWTIEDASGNRVFLTSDYESGFATYYPADRTVSYDLTAGRKPPRAVDAWIKKHFAKSRASNPTLPTRFVTARVRKLPGGRIEVKLPRPARKRKSGSKSR